MWVLIRDDHHPWRCVYISRNVRLIRTCTTNIGCRAMSHKTGRPRSTYFDCQAQNLPLRHSELPGLINPQSWDLGASFPEFKRLWEGKVGTDRAADVTPRCQSCIMHPYHLLIIFGKKLRRFNSGFGVHINEGRSSGECPPAV